MWPFTPTFFGRPNAYTSQLAFVPFLPVSSYAPFEVPFKGVPQNHPNKIGHFGHGETMGFGDLNFHKHPLDSMREENLKTRFHGDPLGNGMRE